MILLTLVTVTLAPSLLALHVLNGVMTTSPKQNRETRFHLTSFLFKWTWAYQELYNFSRNYMMTDTCFNNKFASSVFIFA